ncbi:helix-turn-helix domain-containing protein [Sphingomonas metalli]|uniref:helix-turn-helix domain-containing protein n=1 Tax=Sphingomonas metalli TaxID=1779358 RepID=UPI001E5D910D|nr:DUF4019 domain-containing protein [Sphingomonas metalli]
MTITGYAALTEREKQSLRLLLEGHDAKSMARHLGLSVHTVNERLRDARRKLAVSSSKEAARLLRQAEQDPETVTDKALGDAGASPARHPADPPGEDATPSRRTRRVIGGCIMISLIAALLAVQLPGPSQTTAPSPATAPAETAASRTARDWLALVDAGRWNESYAGTAAPFRTLNTVAAWRAASERARAPLGRMVSRTLLDEQDIPAPPNGYRTVRFRTDFANRRGVIETVSLDRDGGEWKVAGVYIG